MVDYFNVTWLTIPRVHGGLFQGYMLGTGPEQEALRGCGKGAGSLGGL